jgi:mannosyltransferase OCH1-like enzyme
LLPRVFHQIWVGDGPVPERFDAYRESWGRLHPDWEIRLWRDGDLPKLRNRALFDQAKRFVPAANVGQFRADVARYELLWRFGGVYVDVDFEALKPIDDLLGGVGCFAAWEVQDRWVNNAVMGAMPGHPFVWRLIDKLTESVVRRPGQTPNLLSGPHYLTRLYRRHPQGVTVFDQRLFYPYLYSDLDTPKSEPPWPDDAYAVHHWSNQRRKREAVV